jgi:glycosyltransferase involved in cell wall biosynthesis
MSDPELRSRLSEGAKRNATKFTIEAMTEQVEALYQSEIEKRKRG